MDPGLPEYDAVSLVQ